MARSHSDPLVKNRHSFMEPMLPLGLDLITGVIILNEDTLARVGDRMCCLAGVGARPPLSRTQFLCKRPTHAVPISVCTMILL